MILACFFPFRDYILPGPGVSAPALEPRMEKSPHVLVVDEEAQMLEIIREALEGCG